MKLGGHDESKAIWVAMLTLYIKNNTIHSENYL